MTLRVVASVSTASPEMVRRRGIFLAESSVFEGEIPDRSQDPLGFQPADDPFIAIKEVVASGDDTKAAIYDEVSPLPVSTVIFVIDPSDIVGKAAAASSLKGMPVRVRRAAQWGFWKSLLEPSRSRPG